MKPVTFPDRAGNSSRIDRFTDSTRDGLKSGDAAARLEHPTGRRIPAARIAEALKRHDADIVVLSEIAEVPHHRGFAKPCMRSAIDM